MLRMKLAAVLVASTAALGLGMAAPASANDVAAQSLRMAVPTSADDVGVQATTGEAWPNPLFNGNPVQFDDATPTPSCTLLAGGITARSAQNYVDNPPTAVVVTLFRAPTAPNMPCSQTTDIVAVLAPGQADTGVATLLGQYGATHYRIM